MFIRKTRKIDPITKKPYFSFQLIESVRTERGPRQRILLGLGSSLDLDAGELKELANRIEEIARGQVICLPVSEKIESLAQNYASRLIQNLAKPAIDNKETAAVPDYVTINLKSVIHQEARTVGVEDLLLRVAKQLKFPEKLRDLNFPKKQIAIALGTIIARATFPASERSTHSRLIHQSGLGELLDIDFRSTSLNQFYEISDHLLRHKKELEEHIANKQKQIHGYSDTIVLYDLTNTYFEGQAKQNPKAQFGISKEKRKDCPLVTLGLVLNQHGFLSRSEFLPGNVSEPKSLKEAIEALSSAENLFKPTIVMDAGIATEENLQWLREHGYTYIVSARQKTAPTEIEGEFVIVGNSEKSQVRVAELAVNGEEKWLYCESPAKEATSSSMKTFFQKRLEGDLEKLSVSLQKPRGRKKLHKVQERIGRIREKHRAISNCYEINAIPSDDGLTAIRIEWTILADKLENKLTGHYYLRTNLLELGAKEFWDIYNSIRTVEDAFRFMKSSLGMRPVYHQKEKRVDGHLWITVLAYTLIQDIMYRLRARGITYNWDTIRTQLSSRVRVTMRAKTNTTDIIHLRTTTEAEQFHLQLYEALDLSDEILTPKKITL
jgi:transposase